MLRIFDLWPCGWNLPTHRQMAHAVNLEPNLTVFSEIFEIVLLLTFQTWIIYLLDWLFVLCFVSRCFCSIVVCVCVFAQVWFPRAGCDGQLIDWSLRVEVTNTHTHTHRVPPGQLVSYGCTAHRSAGAFHLVDHFRVSFSCTRDNGGGQLPVKWSPLCVLP